MVLGDRTHGSVETRMPLSSCARAAAEGWITNRIEVLEKVSIQKRMSTEMLLASCTAWASHGKQRRYVYSGAF